MIKKKTYQKATMKVVSVETETHLLSGSAAGDFSRAAYSGSSADWD
jgi:hypothetical protein